MEEPGFVVVVGFFWCIFCTRQINHLIKSLIPNKVKNASEPQSAIKQLVHEVISVLEQGLHRGGGVFTPFPKAHDR